MQRIGSVGASGSIGHGIALGHSGEFVTTLVRAQEKRTGAQIVGR